MAVWTVKLPNGSEKGPYEKEKLFELIEKGYFPVDSFFLASNSKKWIDMEAILDFQYQNVRESAAGFVSMDMNMQQSILPTEHPLVEGNTISLSTARKQKARSSTVHIGSKTHFNETLDKNYSKNIPMVQCDELGGLYESTAGYNRKSWKRIGYSRKPLQCVAVNPISRGLVGIRKIERNGNTRNLLVTLKRDFLNEKDGHLFSSEEKLLEFSNVDGAVLNIKTLTYSTCMDNGICKLYGIAEFNNSHAFLGTDSICKIDPKTGEVNLILATGCHDVDAIASPYELLGPLQDIAFLFWSRKLGLHEVHWFGNNRILLVAKETPSYYKRRRLTSLYFNPEGELFGVSGSDVLPFGSMLEEQVQIDLAENGHQHGSTKSNNEIHVAEVPDSKVAYKVSQKEIKKAKEKKKRLKNNVVKTKHQATQSAEAYNEYNEPAKDTVSASTTTEPEHTDHKSFPKQNSSPLNWEYFVMAERERRYQAEANAWQWMQHCYYAQMQSQARMYYQPWFHQNYLQDFSYYASPTIVQQNEQPLPAIQNTLLSESATRFVENVPGNELNVNDSSLEESVDETELEVLTEATQTNPAKSGVIPLCETRTNQNYLTSTRRKSMLNNQKLRRQTSIGSLLVHNDGTNKYGGGSKPQSTYYESFHDFSGPIRATQYSEAFVKATRYLLLGSGMHRGSISGGSMNTGVGQLYIASNEEFRDLCKLGDPIHHLNALAASPSGQVFGVCHGNVLIKIDLRTGNTLTLKRLKLYEDTRGQEFDIQIADIGFGRWIDGHDNLFGLIKSSPEVLNIHSDAIVSIDIFTGRCTFIAETHRRHVTSFASPPLEGGPWGGTIFFFWVEQQGLFGMKWANRQFNISNVIRGPQVSQFHLRSLVFDANNDLIGFGSSMYKITPQERKIIRLKALPLSTLKALILINNEPKKDSHVVQVLGT